MEREPEVGHNYIQREIVNRDGSSAFHPLIDLHPRTGNVLQNEFDLCVAMTKQFDDADSSFVRALGIRDELEHLEYASVLYPWGYTAGEADFLMSFSSDGRRYKIIVIEAKTDKVSDDINRSDRGAVVQVSMYVPWVIQRLMINCVRLPEELEIIPVVLGQRLDPMTQVCVPREYVDNYNINGQRLPVRVASPKFLRYSTIFTYQIGEDHRCEEIRFEDRTGNFACRIEWVPPHGISTGETEKLWVQEYFWNPLKDAQNPQMKLI